MKDVLNIKGCDEKNRSVCDNIEGEKMHLTTQVDDGQLELFALLSRHLFS